MARRILQSCPSCSSLSWTVNADLMPINLVLCPWHTCSSVMKGWLQSFRYQRFTRSMSCSSRLNWNEYSLLCWHRSSVWLYFRAFNDNNCMTVVSLLRHDARASEQTPLSFLLNTVTVASANFLPLHRLGTYHFFIVVVEIFVCLVLSRVS